MMLRWNRRRVLAAGLAGLFSPAAALVANPVWGQQVPGEDLSGDMLAAELLTPETDAAIDAGLAFLSTRQNEEGSFGVSGYSRNVAICALAGMAFMSSGSTPGRGPYGEAVDRIVGYLLANSQESGFLVAPGTSSHGPMYGHGFATLFLAEVYGMSLASDVRETLAKAARLIVNTQNSDGGWRYQPERHDADLSVTICQVMALRASKNAGLDIPQETIDRSLEYIRRSQNPDGGFMYMLEAGGPSAFPRSAAGIVGLYSAGVYEGEELAKGLEYLLQHVPRHDAVGRDNHFFYGHYYAVQAMWHCGGDNWIKWYPAIRDTLLARQRQDGSWMDSICPEYGTAMAAIILQMPNSYLPIFQR